MFFAVHSNPWMRVVCVRKVPERQNLQRPWGCIYLEEPLRRKGKRQCLSKSCPRVVTYRHLDWLEPSEYTCSRYGPHNHLGSCKSVSHPALLSCPMRYLPTHPFVTPMKSQAVFIWIPYPLLR